MGWSSPKNRDFWPWHRCRPIDFMNFGQVLWKGPGTLMWADELDQRLTKQLTFSREKKKKQPVHHMVFAWRIKPPVFLVKGNRHPKKWQENGVQLWIVSSFFFSDRHLLLVTLAPWELFFLAAPPKNDPYMSEVYQRGIWCSKGALGIGEMKGT